MSLADNADMRRMARTVLVGSLITVAVIAAGPSVAFAAEADQPATTETGTLDPELLVLALVIVLAFATLILGARSPLAKSGSSRTSRQM